MTTSKKSNCLLSLSGYIRGYSNDVFSDGKMYRVTSLGVSSCHSVRSLTIRTFIAQNVIKITSKPNFVMLDRLKLNLLAGSIAVVVVVVVLAVAVDVSGIFKLWL